MEFQLLNIEETLERSKKVLMNSLEVNHFQSRPPLGDRTVEIKSRDNEDPEDYRVYLDKIKYLSTLKAKDNERRLEIEKLSNGSNSLLQDLDSKNHTIDKLKLEMERSQIRQQNEELRNKINSFQKDALDAERLKNSIEEIKNEKKVLEKKYQSEYKTSSQVDILEIKSQVDKLQEKSQNRFKELSGKLEKLLCENAKLKEAENPADCSMNDLEKYKVLVKSLKKKLKNVSKKYRDLKKKDTSFSQRNQSLCKKKIKTGRVDLKTPHARGKSNERNLTPNRLIH